MEHGNGEPNLTKFDENGSNGQYQDIMKVESEYEEREEEREWKVWEFSMLLFNYQVFIALTISRPIYAEENNQKARLARI